VVFSKLVDFVLVLLVAIPTGRLGDAYGRRKILGATLAGVCCWLSVIFVVCKFWGASSTTLVDYLH
jgi:MFS family permease